MSVSPRDGWVYCEFFPQKGETEVLAKDSQLERGRIWPRFADTKPMFPVFCHSAPDRNETVTKLDPLEASSKIQLRVGTRHGSSELSGARTPPA